MKELHNIRNTHQDWPQNTCLGGPNSSAYKVSTSHQQCLAEAYVNTTEVCASEQSLDIVCGQDRQRKLRGYLSWAHGIRVYGRIQVMPQWPPHYILCICKGGTKKFRNPFKLPQNWQMLKVKGICFRNVTHPSCDKRPNTGCKVRVNFCAAHYSGQERALTHGRNDIEEGFMKEHTILASRTLPTGEEAHSS